MKLDKMPRKMKKNFKKLVKFYEERKQDYEQEQSSKMSSFIGFLILEKLAQMGINPDDVVKIENINGELFVKLKASMQKAEITLTMGD